MIPLFAACLLTLQSPTEVEGIEPFRVRSELLSGFAGEEVHLEAGVVVPPDLAPGVPICFSIHGLGGSYRNAWTQGARVREWMTRGDYPPMLYVYVDANGPFGHTVFADSACNGPWARAFVEELVPAIEEFFEAGGSPEARFLTGHSSGGWASLWLQVQEPGFFGGAWATAPDSVDFRDLNGLDLYTFDNAYVDPDGHEIPMLRQGAEFVMTSRELSALPEYDVQLLSSEAAFGPRGPDGRPRRLFDRATGAIDPEVARAWRAYDLGRILREREDELRAPLAGKLHVFVGSHDTYRLEGAVRLLGADLARRKWDATVVVAEGRDHQDLFRPHPELWPRLLTRIHREMWATHLASKETR